MHSNKKTGRGEIHFYLLHISEISEPFNRHFQLYCHTLMTTTPQFCPFLFKCRLYSVSRRALNAAKPKSEIHVLRRSYAQCFLAPVCRNLRRNYSLLFFAALFHLLYNLISGLRHESCRFLRKEPLIDV